MKKSWRNIILLTYTIIISILMTSCTGSRELQTLASVTSIAVDLVDNNKILITCEIVNPTSGGTATGGTAGTSALARDVVFAQGEGETVFEAIRNITLHFDRKLFFSHTTILIFGEEFAKNGITEFMDIFLRDNEPRENMYLLVAKGSKAYDVIGVKGELSLTAGNYINDLMNNYKYSSKSFRISMAEYYRYFYDVSNEPVIGNVRKIVKKVIDEERKKDTPEKAILDVGGGAVFRRDYLVGYLTEDEIFGYNFIVNQIKGGLIPFSTPENLKDNKAVIGKERNWTTVEIISSNTRKKIDIIDDKIHLNIDIKIKGFLGEVNKAIDVENLELIKVLENTCSEKVKSLVVDSIDKVQNEFKQDNFGIGEVVHREYPKLWKEIARDWNNIFPDISYSVNVHTDIVKTGIMNVPSNLRKRR